MSNKIDLSDPYKGLEDDEKEFIYTLIDDIKLTEAELRAKFGNRYEIIRNNLELRRISAEIKISRKRRKSLVDSFKLEQLVQAIPLAMHTLIKIMKEGKEENKLRAAQTLLKPSFAYLEKYASSVASLESLDLTKDERELLSADDVQARIKELLKK